MLQRAEQNLMKDSKNDADAISQNGSGLKVINVGNDQPHACIHADRALLAMQDSQYFAASERDDVAMNGTITSQNCRIQLQLTAATSHQEQYYSKAVNYTLLITALSFIQAR